MALGACWSILLKCWYHRQRAQKFAAKWYISELLYLVLIKVVHANRWIMLNPKLIDHGRFLNSISHIRHVCWRMGLQRMRPTSTLFLRATGNRSLTCSSRPRICWTLYLGVRLRLLLLSFTSITVVCWTPISWDMPPPYGSMIRNLSTQFAGTALLRRGWLV